jgi:hypothetical protein
VAIRHLNSGQYIAEANKSLRVADKLGPQSCTFGLWKRPNGMFGLQHKLTGRWIGQTALAGSLACSANKFSAREEWQVSKHKRKLMFCVSDTLLTQNCWYSLLQADEDWKDTRLLCASAGWGNGGYLVVRNGKVTIGGGDTLAKKQADLWCIEELENTNIAT